MGKEKKFSEKTVNRVLGAVAIFIIVVLYISYKNMLSLDTLIISFFGFCSVEAWNLASITKTKEQVRKGGNNDADYRDQPQI